MALVFEFIGNVERPQRLLAALGERLRVRGDEGDLAQVLNHQATLSLLAGDLKGAGEHVRDALRMATLTVESI